MTRHRRVLDLALNPGEGATGYLSRLAARNGISLARHFCNDVEMSFQRILQGHPEEMARLANISGVLVRDLQCWSMVTDGSGYLLRGQELVRQSVHRKAFRVCPACLIADVAASSHTPDVAACARAVWQVASIRTCLVHDIGLVGIEREGSATSHDFTAVLRPRLGGLDEMLEAAPRRCASPLEGYIVRRLQGDAPAPVPFLDGLPLHAASRTCEVVGAVALHGRAVEFKDLSSDDWHTAGMVGYDIAAAGEIGIREMMSELQRNQVKGASSNCGPHAPFGVLYHWLNAAAPKGAYAPLREVFRRHVEQTTPVGPGDECLGDPVTRRVLHSVRSASLETGLHPKRLRKVIAAAKFLDGDHVALTDNEAVFDAVSSASLLANLATAIPLAKVGDYLGCGRVQARLLMTHEIIKPLVHAAATEGWHGFSKASLDAFLARMLAASVPVEETADEMDDIPAAAKRLHCSAMEIVHLILDGKLQWVGRHVGRAGYLSVLVRPEEVAPFVRGQELDGLTLLEARNRLRTSDPVIRGLVEVEALTTVTGISPLNRAPVIVVTQESFEAFRDKYISLTELSREFRLSAVSVQQDLDCRDVVPAFRQADVGAAFYRLADVASFIAHWGRIRGRNQRTRKVG